jgi:hypothetical protein
MKNVVCLLSYLFICLSAGILHGQTLPITTSPSAVEDQKKIPDEKKESKLSSVLPSSYYLFSFNAGYGLTYPAGTITGNGSQQRKYGQGYLFGINSGYHFDNYAELLCRIEYSSADLKLKKTYMQSPVDYTLSMKFLDIGLGYRGFYKYFYWEAGLFGGFKILSWKETVETNGSSTTNTLDGQRAGWIKNVFGGYMGVGWKYTPSDTVAIFTGPRISGTFTPAYNNDDTLYPIILLLTCEATMRIK